MTTPSELGNLLNGPALQPPPGVEPNFTNPHNSKTVIVAIEAICLALPTLAIFMRIYTQACITRKLVLEDCRCFLFSSLMLWLTYLRHNISSMGTNLLFKSTTLANLL